MRTLLQHLNRRNEVVVPGQQRLREDEMDSQRSQSDNLDQKVINLKDKLVRRAQNNRSFSGYQIPHNPQHLN